MDLSSFSGFVPNYRVSLLNTIRERSRMGRGFVQYGNKRFRLRAPTSTKTRVGSRTLVKRRSKKSRRYGIKRIHRIPGAGFPHTKTVRLTSTHLIDLNPDALDNTAFVSINVANPLDPIDTADSQGMTIDSTEHHPAYWSIYEQIYERFEVIACKVSVIHLANNITNNCAYFIVASSTKENDEVKAVCQDTITFATRIHEMFPGRGRVMYTANGSGENAEKVTMSKAVNIAKLEGVKDKADNVLIGQTSRNDTEGAPTRTPKIYAGFGTLRSSIDIAQSETIVKIDYIVRFTARSRQEGAAV